jgi:hypothetical protein
MESESDIIAKRRAWENLSDAEREEICERQDRDFWRRYDTPLERIGLILVGAIGAAMLVGNLLIFGLIDVWHKAWKRIWH